MQQPEKRIMDWTVMPAAVTVRAWTDDDFRERLLEDAPTAMSLVLRSAPPNAVVVVEDTETVRHLPLPEKPSGISDVQLGEQLKVEIGDDESFKWTLPTAVVEMAFKDDNFRAQLTSEPSAAIRSLGLNPPEGLKILENNGGHRWLILPRNPNADTPTPEAMVNLLHQAFGGVTVSGTTRCCAGGTRS